ncbi:hypothetical protein DBZ36_11405 [Alginatibacterium sediminis]|uniref:ABM domain-containing protein n=1 Tax=Alginatibacterium sediminis TaxID=2164068 RepID=A0A420EAZ9_9ALTE|nr:hypothetical protein [Alginatibacterium sediminis]RKF17856.1 hypothetical protein DBZ36_11405 [Alginatibacterium sediminis]
MNSAIEFIKYSLKDQIFEQGFLSLQQRIYEFMQQQSGFCHRMLVQQTDLDYVDVIQWKSPTLAKRAKAMLVRQPCMQEMLEYVDEQSLCSLQLDASAKAGLNNS